MGFWEQSWNNIDSSRVEAYKEGFNFDSDGIIDFLKEKQCHKVLDAGCGCGIYALKLAKLGFEVDGFDVAGSASDIAMKLMSDNGFTGKFLTEDIKNTRLVAERYDAVISRDVIDHMTKADAKLALKELLRLTKNDGYVIVTVDSLDDEYVSEPHIVDADGNYCFNAGKWNGMVFHPYDKKELNDLVDDNTEHYLVDLDDGLMLVCRRNGDKNDFISHE